MNTFRASIASHESGLLPGHLAMPVKHDSFVIAPEDRILVTGATGFIGSHAVEGLLDRGFRNLLYFARPSSELAGIEAILKRRPRQVVRAWDLFIKSESEIVDYPRAILQPRPQHTLPQANRTRPAGSGSIRCRLH